MVHPFCVICGVRVQRAESREIALGNAVCKRHSNPEVKGSLGHWTICLHIPALHFLPGPYFPSAGNLWQGYQEFNYIYWLACAGPQIPMWFLRSLLVLWSMKIKKIDSAWAQILTLPLTSHATLRQLSNLSVPQFPQLWNGDNDNTYFIRVLVSIKLLMKTC